MQSETVFIFSRSINKVFIFSRSINNVLGMVLICCNGYPHSIGTLFIYSIAYSTLSTEIYLNNVHTVIPHILIHTIAW